MTCRRVSRELLERFRFGEELDHRSAPHLAHLVDCAECRDAVGMERQLVIQLQRALRERVAGHEPSPRAFNAIRIRALAVDEPEPWTSRFGRFIRLVPAGAAMALMVVAALGGLNGNQATLLEARSITWPGVMERVDNGPLNPHEAAWWLQHQPAPSIKLPSTGILASVDPNPEGKPLPPPKPETGFIE